ncbi:antitoxin VbhA family protein [Patulibacter sp. SYSU D01012]|uniref:antitoxin VbhA family protein n=1 Tax=Patulibacter sp. SYSU D01012 TaxID=2817381 RepID=UPI001B315F83
MSDRRRDVAGVVGTLRAEGLVPDDETHALMQAWADGLISRDDLSRARAAVLAGESLQSVFPHVDKR